MFSHHIPNQNQEQKLDYGRTRPDLNPSLILKIVCSECANFQSFTFDRRVSSKGKIEILENILPKTCGSLQEEEQMKYRIYPCHN